MDQPKNPEGAYVYWQRRVERAKNVMKQRPRCFLRNDEGNVWAEREGEKGEFRSASDYPQGYYMMGFGPMQSAYKRESQLFVGNMPAARDD